MIRPLRVWHRRMISILALVVPALLVAALAVRRPAPTDSDAADPLEQERFRPERVTQRISSAPPLPAIEVELAGLALSLHTALFDERPDVLLYWSADRPASGGTWPGEAHLLGSGDGHFDGFLLLPEAARKRDGWLVLYSVAHREVVAELQLPTADGER